MDLFRRRPLVLICFISTLIMVLSLNVGQATRTILLLAFAVLVLLGIVLLIVFIKKDIVKLKRFTAFVFFAIITLAMLCSANSFAVKNDYVNSKIQNMVEVTGTVTGVRFKSSNESSFEVNISTIGAEATDVDLVLTVLSHSSLKVGDSFAAHGTLGALSVFEEAFVVADGFNGKLVCEIEDVKIKGVQTGYNDSIFKRANAYFQNILSEKTDEETGILAGALLLGNRDGLDDGTLKDFRRCGISHMLALSGLHMSIIIGFFDFIMKNLLVDKNIRCVLLIFLSFSYLAITGFSPSASRSVIMLCIVYVSYLLSIDTDSVTSLFIALTVILLISPYSVYDIGLWLSFFATLGILVVSDIVSVLKYHIKKKSMHIRILIYITVSVAITLAAVFSTCVFTWLYFGEISLVSPLTNLILSPIMTLVLILGMLLIILSPITFLAVPIGSVLTFITAIFTDIASSISRFRGITVSLKYDFVPYIIVPLAVALIIMLIIRLKHKWVLFVPPLISVLTFIVALNIYNANNAELFDVIYIKDKRSEMLIVSTLDETSICDISTGGYSNLYSACYESSSLEYLTEIENIIITHYHNYHANSLSKICNKYMVRNVYLPLAENEEEQRIQSDIIEALNLDDTNLSLYKRGAGIKDSKGNVISVSQGEYVERSRHPTFVISVSGDTKSLVYTTSAFFETDKNKVLSPTDILIVGSHGPTVKNFSDKDFLSEYFETIAQTIVFSSPYEMLENEEIIDYINYLYQNGHKIIIDGKNYYKFDLS